MEKNPATSFCLITAGFINFAKLADYRLTRNDYK